MLAFDTIKLLPRKMFFFFYSSIGYALGQIRQMILRKFKFKTYSTIIVAFCVCIKHNFFAVFFVTLQTHNVREIVTLPENLYNMPVYSSHKRKIGKVPANRTSKNKKKQQEAFNSFPEVFFCYIHIDRYLNIILPALITLSLET